MESGAFQNSQRLRYEALSNFAVALNRASRYADLCTALSDQAKYIVDFYKFRLSHRYKETAYCFEIGREECLYFKQKKDEYWQYENEVLAKDLPVNFSKADFANKPQQQKALFNDTESNIIYSLPVHYHEQQTIVISITVKKNIRYIDSDFRFLKSIADLVANKLMQLNLHKQIEKSNKELKAKNAQITKLNRTLEQTVAVRTAELTATNEELITLFYRTSHDFRAPLANIMGLANLAKLVTKDEEALNLFEKCEEVATRLDAMLRKLNILSTYSYQHQYKQVDFKLLIDELKTRHASQLNEIGGQMIYDINIDEAHVSNPYTYITILENLIENSIKYHKGNLLIQIYIFKFKSHLVIKFSDNGQGIHPRVVNRIYDMYYRGHAESTGSGLGLYVVRKLVKSLSGDIFVQTKHKHHTHFIIKIPFKQL